jgi:serine protease Do
MYTALTSIVAFRHCEETTGRGRGSPFCRSHKLDCHARKGSLAMTIIPILLISFACFADTPISSSSVPDEVPSAASINIQKLYPSFADIVEPLMPAVVNIQIEYSSRGGADALKQTPIPEKFFSDNLFDFLERQFNSNSPFLLEEPKYIGNGSGFIIDEAGFIVTNYHVIVNADSIKIKLLDNSEFIAKLIGSDPKTDLALLKIDAKRPLPFVKFGKSSAARVGDWIIAIGNQFGLGGTVTAGIISFKGRDIDIDLNVGGAINNFLQTDAAINKGNSGGPMFNLQGEVIGVNTAIYSPSPSGASVGIGFAIPSDSAQKIIEALKTHGEVVRGALDVTIQEISDEMAEALGLSNNKGVLLVQVLPHGAGEKAGLKPGDVITSFGGKQVENSRHLQILVAETPIDHEIKIEVTRSGKNIELTAKISKSENSSLFQEDLIKNDTDKLQNIDNNLQKDGITFSDMTPKMIKNYNLPENAQGVIVSKIERNQKNYGLQIGDIILAINQTPIDDIKKFNEIYQAAYTAKKKNIVLLVKRNSINLYVAFPII